MFLFLLAKLLPLYGTVALGYVAGRHLHIQRESVAKIVLFILVPCIMFSGVMKAEFTLATLAVPLVTYAMSATLSLLFYRIGRVFYQDATANIIGCTAGTGNTGYFGLPVAMVLFDEATVAVYILMILGVTLSESTVGYFLAARGHATWREAVRKTLKLPTVYAFAFGCLLQAFAVALPQPVWDFLGNVRGAYTILGMMIVGLGMAGLSSFTLDKRFIGITYTAKFVAWPLLALAVIALDEATLQLYGAPVHQALLVLSIVPMAANSVVIASLLGIVPEKVASSVLLSTLISVAYVPLMVAWLL